MQNEVNSDYEHSGALRRHKKKIALALAALSLGALGVFQRNKNETTSSDRTQSIEHVSTTNVKTVEEAVKDELGERQVYAEILKPLPHESIVDGEVRRPVFDALKAILTNPDNYDDIRVEVTPNENNPDYPRYELSKDLADGKLVQMNLSVFTSSKGEIDWSNSNPYYYLRLYDKLGTEELNSDNGTTRAVLGNIKGFSFSFGTRDNTGSRSILEVSGSTAEDGHFSTQENRPDTGISGTGISIDQSPIESAHMAGDVTADILSQLLG